MKVNKYIIFLAILILSGIFIFSLKSFRQEIFIKAASKGDVAIVKSLLKLGVDINGRVRSRYEIGTALQNAAWRGHTEIVKILLDAKANVNVRDGSGRTALWYAVSKGHSEIVKLLLEAKADANFPLFCGMTPLMEAAFRGHTETVKILLKNKADINIKYKDGCTALHWALLNAEEAEDENIEIIKALLEAGADVNLKDGGETALIKATRDGNTEIVKVLLKAGADVNIKDKYGKTALMIATENRYLDIVNLLKYGINNSNIDNSKEKNVISIIEPIIPREISWIDINDPGIKGHEGFKGQMSKYETTNAQYCQFLNAALATGDIVVERKFVKGASGSNRGADFIHMDYYDLKNKGYHMDIINGGASRIKYNGSSFSVEKGFENHPVSCVSWYGATAFCNYYGWRLPTEWEWRAVADYDGSYIYGCGTSINPNIANYKDSVHPYGTTPVGAFGTYGYGMADMAGNVWEWTNSLYSSEYDTHVMCGGSCFYNEEYDLCIVNCRVATSGTSTIIGFRVCR